jgi:hypothetical protein
VPAMVDFEWPEPVIILSSDLRMICYRFALVCALITGENMSGPYYALSQS